MYKRQLIDRAIEMGFLSEGGQISFSIDTPDEALFREYGEELTDEVLRHLQDRFTITVEIVNSQTGETESTEGTQNSAPASQEIISVPAPSEQETAPADDDTDYGPAGDGVTDYGDSDYGPGSDGVTDYTAPAETAEEPPEADSGSSSYGESSYDSSNYEDDDDDGGDDDSDDSDDDDGGDDDD